MTTSFLPGIGQKVNDTWTYFHSDALGSVRHLTGPAGQVLGDIRYSPFGEVEDSTGLAPAFGFTGGQQESTLGLVYLRARVYSPALGRFLTPDSLIPDVTNGQSLNAYAYVYNDPVNLVDPTGHFGVLPNDPLTAWWHREPEDCSCSYGGPASYLLNSEFHVPVLGTRTTGDAGNWGAQGLWALGSTPAVRTGTTIAEKYQFFTTRTIRMPGSLRWLPKIGNWQATLPKYQPGWYESSKSIGVVNRGWLGSQKDGLYRTGLRTRVRLENTSYQGVFNSIKGAFGSVVLAGLIDGIFQFASDSALCLSPAQRFNRASLATALGFVGGAAAAAVFIGVTAFGGPMIVAAGLSFVAGLAWSELMARPIKNYVFDTHPWY